MKLFLAIAFVATVVSAGITPEQREKAKEHIMVCIKETGASEEAVAKLKSGDFSNNDEKTQCFAKCFMEKAGFLDAQGKFQEDVIVEKLSKGNDVSKVKALLAKCKQEKGNTACETAYKVYQCAYTNKAL